MNNLTTIDIFNLIASISSIILAVVAIVLSLVFYFGSRSAEISARLAVGRIEQTTDTLNSLSMRMLNKVTTAILAPRPLDEKLLEIIQSNTKTGLTEVVEPKHPTEAQLEQLRIDNLIAALYYSCMTNLAYQAYLPSNIGETTGMKVIADMVDQSKADFGILNTWMLNTENYVQKINDSPVKHMYDKVIELSQGVLSVREHFTMKEALQAIRPESLQKV